MYEIETAPLAEKKMTVLDWILKYWILILFIGGLAVNAVRSEAKLEQKLDKEDARQLIIEALKAHEMYQREMDQKTDEMIRQQLNQLDRKVTDQGVDIKELRQYMMKK